MAKKGPQFGMKLPYRMFSENKNKAKQNKAKKLPYHVLSRGFEALKNSVLTDVQLLQTFFAFVFFVDRT